MASFDTGSQSDILVYDSTQWVAYMSDDTKEARRNRYESLNFAGTSDWAIDLQIDAEDDGCSTGTCDEEGVLYVSPEIYGTISDANVKREDEQAVTCTPGCVVILPPYQLPTPTTIVFPPYVTSLEVAWTTTSASKGSDGHTTTITTMARTVVSTTLTVPDLTTTAIDFWNTIVPNATATTITALSLTPSILAPPFVITDNPDPLGVGATHSAVKRTITPAPWPWRELPFVDTSLPTATESVPSTVSYTTGAPGPSCTADCGSLCEGVFCVPLIPVVCVTPPCVEVPPPCIDCGDFWDPDDPEHPPTEPEDDEPDQEDEEDEPCQTDVVTETGLCPNGNMPIFSPITDEMHCDYDAEDAPSWLGSCQSAIDDDLSDAVAEAELSTQCCSDSKKRELGIFDLPATKNKRAPSCPVPATGGSFTFTCDFDKWPNVCANARSAISERGQPSVLTYRQGSKLHVTDPWYHGKWQPGGQPQTEFDGWGLINCEVEEYPFGSGNPDRGEVTNLWDRQSVLRLIPREENGAHANALKKFYKDNNMPNLAPYTVVFENGPTGTTDDDYYLGDDTSHNVCAAPYGNAFLLVNAANVDAGERSYG